MANARAECASWVQWLRRAYLNDQGVLLWGHLVAGWLIQPAASVEHMVVGWDAGAGEADFLAILCAAGGEPTPTAPTKRPTRAAKSGRPTWAKATVHPAAIGRLPPGCAVTDSVTHPGAPYCLLVPARPDVDPAPRVHAVAEAVGLLVAEIGIEQAFQAAWREAVVLAARGHHVGPGAVGAAWAAANALAWDQPVSANFGLRWCIPCAAPDDRAAQKFVDAVRRANIRGHKLNIWDALLELGLGVDLPMDRLHALHRKVVSGLSRRADCAVRGGGAVATVRWR